MDLNLKVLARQDSLPAPAEGVAVDARANKLGQLVVMDFYTQMAIEARCFQVKAGTISVPIVGDVVITDTKAEMSVDAPLGTTIMPVYCNISFNLAAGTLFESAGKSVAGASTGTAMVPLPLYSGGPASACSAHAATAGGCVAGAELVTTTLRHFSWSQPIAAGAWETTYDWTPRVPPVLNGARCFYVQIAGTGTAPSYYAHFDYIELPTANLS